MENQTQTGLLASSPVPVNIKQLARDIIAHLRQGILGGLADPARIALATRAAEALAAAGVSSLGGELNAEAAEHVRGAYAVLAGLASAQAEEAAAAVKEAISAILGRAIQVAIAGLSVAMRV